MYGTYLRIDNLSQVMIALVSFVGICVATFSSRYLKGDRGQNLFNLNLAALISSLCIMVTADHLLIFYVAWVVSNYLLTRLMSHKREWQAAINSSTLAARNFLLGAIFLGISFVILYLATNQIQISKITNSYINQTSLTIAGSLLLMSAMTQSGLLPFHRWLISSLNSPTPVSAIMHAGLINGGGYLLVRFAKLFIVNQTLLNIMFLAGIITAVIGMLWKLIQNDIKRMLACSTMSQMGYMVAQCGLGLFSSAVAHLCWHGLFKAYLFLASGSAAKERRLDLPSQPTLKQLIITIPCGLMCAYMFSIGSDQNIFITNTTVFVFFIVFISGVQLALGIVRQHVIRETLFALIFVSLAGLAYGLIINIFEKKLATLEIFQPQKLNALHVIFMLLLGGMWLIAQFAQNAKKINFRQYMLMMYVKMLNASQPHPKTITTHKHAYKY